MVTAAQIRKASKGVGNAANLNSVVVALDRYGPDVGLDLPHRQAHYLAQLMHESGSFRYDQEIWGPTKAQIGYDTRTDLGNTPEKDGDGFKYRGRGPIQITGKSNYGQFRDWCRKQGYNCPDFVADPDAVNTDPWEGLVPIWYWTTRGLNKWADQNDIETITKKINGGKNGLADRIDYYGRMALVMCGFEPTDAGVRGFQKYCNLDQDGDVGPKTRACLHKRLVELGKIEGAPSALMTQTSDVRSAPVVEEKAVVPETVEKDVKKKFSLTGLFGGGGAFGGIGLAAFAGMDWQVVVVLCGTVLLALLLGLILRKWIVNAIKQTRQDLADA
jgi:putative chitinase